jgi:hypothetical protein
MIELRDHVNQEEYNSTNQPLVIYLNLNGSEIRIPGPNSRQDGHEGRYDRNGRLMGIERHPYSGHS